MLDKPREIAVKTLYKIDKEKAYSNIALNELINENKQILTNTDIGFISEIVYGTVSFKLTIDEIISKYSKIKIKKISDYILNILRIAVYQIIFLDKVPKSAAVNESVNLAKRYGHKASASFVNAVLRKISKEDYIELNNIENDVIRISKVHSIPEWMIEELLKEKDIKEVEEICRCSNIRPKISIRINNLKTNKEELTKRLVDKKISVDDGILEDFLIVSNIRNIENLSEFREGLFTVQDEVAGLSSLVLDPNSNDMVLDMCSAPGGKTTYLAELMENKGNIIANDIHEHRVKLVRDTCNRLGITNVETTIGDATNINEEYISKFDKILLDVPCLGIGVLKRKPDIKWNRNKEDIEAIRDIQYKILENASKYLKINGEIVYSTCSIFKSENEGIVKKFLEKNKEFYVEKIDFKKSNVKNNFFRKYLNEKNMLKVYQNDKTDGFFVCKLKQTNIENKTII